MENIGRTITDYYCGGFFGRYYNLENSKIVGEGEKWIVIETTSGVFHLGQFDDCYNKEYFLREWCSIL